MSQPTRIGKFEIIRRLGKGAMGEVFLGRDPVLDRQVAVKTILSSTAFGEEALARFEREARATASLNHPNIVTVFDFGQEEGLHYLVMELVDGVDLETLIRQKSASKLALMEIMAQVAEGLGYAHERGIVHRDVKPANVLVVRRGNRYQAKLMDFGVALLERSNLTQQNVWMGTATYMAPEYLDSGKATPSSDLFSVGVMMYEALSGGRKPFDGETTTNVLNAILHHEPPPLETPEIQDVPPALVSLVLRCIAKDPAKRFQDAETMATAIRNAVQAGDDAGSQDRTMVLSEVPKGSASPSPKTLIVGKGGRANCLSLRVAMRQAEQGSRILLLPGTYRESVVLDKDVEIVGEGEPGQVKLEVTGSPSFQVKTGRAAIRGLSFSACQEKAGCVVPVVIQTGSLVVEDCHWAECAPFGVEVKRGASATLIRSRMEGGEGVGVLVRAGGSLQMEACVIAGCQKGSLELEGEARAELKQCQLSGSRFVGLVALENARGFLDGCELKGHGAAAIAVASGASLQMKGCLVQDNAGYGLVFMDGGLGTLDECEIQGNGRAGILLQSQGSLQAKGCRIHDGKTLGIVCANRGRGVLESCEIYGNAKSGGKVEPGGSLLLLRCVLRDGRDTGMLLFEDAELTLEECAVHHNARGGILLAKDAADPILRGGNLIEDDLLRASARGGIVKLSPVKR